MKAKNIIILLLIVAVLFFVGSASFAYFASGVSGNTNVDASSTTITQQIGEVEFNGTSSFDSSTLDDIYPGFIGVQTFTIAPYQDGSNVYEIDLAATVPQAFSEDIKITLYKTSNVAVNNIERVEGSLSINNNEFVKQDTLTINGTLEKVYEATLVTTEKTVLEQVEFTIANNAFTTPTVTPDGYYTYYAVYSYLNNGDQNNQQGLDFSSKITVRYLKEKTKYIAETILGLVPDADPTSTVEINNGTDASGCTNTLAYDDFGNLRYTGANPCNYVTFNGENAGWRIIGVFDGYVKLIRNESIGDYSWDTSALSVNTGYGVNQWGESGTYTGADLMKLLNPGYDDNMDDTNHYDENWHIVNDGNQLVNNSIYWNRSSGICYTGEENVYTECDFSGIGLTDSAKNLIDKHIWNMGSYGTNDVEYGEGFAKNFYEYEKSNVSGKICTSGSTCNDNVERTTVWNGYIGLMSASDYGYAVGGDRRTSCLTNSTLRFYSADNCYMDDWLSNYTLEIDEKCMLFNPISSSSGSVGVLHMNQGYVDIQTVAIKLAVRPALFLKSNVVVTSGNGSLGEPYTLSME